MLQTCSLEETEVRGDRWRLRAASQNLQSWSPHSACWRTESVKLQGGLLCRAGGRPTVLPQLLTGTAFPSSPWAAYKCLSGVFPFIWEEGKKQCYSAPFPSVLCSSHLSHLLFFFFLPFCCGVRLCGMVIGQKKSSWEMWNRATQTEYCVPGLRQSSWRRDRAPGCPAALVVSDGFSGCWVGMALCVGDP